MKIKFKNIVLDNTLYMIKKWLEWDKKGFFICLVRIPIIVILPIIIAYVPKAIINNVTNSKNIVDLTLKTLLLILIFVFISWMDPYLRGINNFVANKICMKFRILFFKKIMTIDYEILEKASTKTKLQKSRMYIEDGIENCNLFYGTFIKLCANSFGLITYAFFIFMLDKHLSIIILLTSIIELIISKHQQQLWEQNYICTSKTMQSINYLSHISSNNEYLKDVREPNIAKWIKEDFDNLLTEFNSLHNLNFIKVSKIIFIRNLLDFIRLIVFLYYTYKCINNNTFAISDFVFNLSVFLGFSSWFSQITIQSQHLKRVCIHCNNFRNFLAIENSNQSNKKIKNNNNLKNTLIQSNSLNYKYKNFENFALSNININLEKNNKIAIVGENGAGKTTLIKILSGLYKNFKGNLTFATNLKSISVLFRESILLPLTIAENITLSEEKINYTKLNKIIEIVGLNKCINNLKNGLNTYLIPQVNENGINLSGGETQKIFLARALYKISDVLILDEPTSFFDITSEKNLTNNFSQNFDIKILIVITHNIKLVRNFDKIIFMKNGKISEEGTHKELMEIKGEYWKLYNSKSENITWEQKQ